MRRRTILLADEIIEHNFDAMDIVTDVVENVSLIILW